jgi:hypothetical protein
VLTGWQTVHFLADWFLVGPIIILALAILSARE